MSFNEIYIWLFTNRQWVFDGFGVAVILSIISFLGWIFGSKGNKISQKQQSGDNSVNIQSAGDVKIECDSYIQAGQLTVNNFEQGLEGRVLDLLKEERFIDAEREIGRSLRMISNSHVDPNWRYDFSIDNNQVHIISKPDHPLLNNITQKLEVILIIPPELLHIGDFYKILEYGRRKQIDLEFHLTELKTYTGDYLTEHIKPGDGQDLVMRVKPVPFPIIKCYLIIGDVKVEEIWLQIENIADDSTIRINNRNQHDRLLDFNWELQIEKNKTNLNFKIPFGKASSAKSRLLFEEILESAHLGLECEIRLIENDRFFFKGILNTSDLPEHSNSHVRLYQDIVKLENHFGIVFNLPDIIEAQDLNQVAKLCQIIDTGIYER